MKHKTLVKTLSLLNLLASMTMVGCGVVPSSYRGYYDDKQAGVSLELRAQGGVFKKWINGVAQETKADAKDLSFEKLMAAESGLYISTAALYANLTEVYWVQADASTRQEAADLVWFNAEVFFTRIDAQSKDKAQQITLEHCAQGTVMLDVQTKRWQVGCSAGQDEFRFLRTGN